MASTLTLDQCALVRSTFDQLMPISNDFVHLFYNRLFEIKPSVRPLFNTRIDQQAPKLIATLAIVIKTLEDLDALIPGIEGLAKRHVEYGVQAEDYRVAGEALLWAIERMLKDQFTPDIKQAWANTYTALAEICVQSSYF
jgi:hemoglobin-like flavoprotein